MFFHLVQSLCFLLPWQEYKLQDSSECLFRGMSHLFSKKRKNRSSHKATLSWEVSIVGFQPEEASTSYTPVCIFCGMFVRTELSAALAHRRILFPVFIIANCVFCSGFHQHVKSPESLPCDLNPGILPSFAARPLWKNVFFFKEWGMT